MIILDKNSFSRLNLLVELFLVHALFLRNLNSMVQVIWKISLLIK